MLIHLCIACVSFHTKMAELSTENRNHVAWKPKYHFLF